MIEFFNFLKLSLFIVLGLLGLDFNLDDSVDVADIGALVSATLEEELTDEQIEMFDVNNDGIVNVIDIVAVINQILGGS